MRTIAKAVAKIDDEIKIIEGFRDRLPEGSDAIGTMNAEIDILKRVRERLAPLLEAKPKKEKKSGGSSRRAAQESK